MRLWRFAVSRFFRPHLTSYGGSQSASTAFVVAALGACPVRERRRTAVAGRRYTPSGATKGVKIIKASQVLFIGLFVCPISTVALAQSAAPGAAVSHTAHYDGAEWHLKGEGVVCCPCAVPCPCRTNGGPTYGHCEATLYLHVREGHYGQVPLNDLKMVDTSGPCGMSYEKISAVYLDSHTTPEVEEAFFKLLASFSSAQTVDFRYVRMLPIEARITEGHLFNVSIPGILEMIVDRNWGQTSPPLTAFAAQDRFANALQYVQNIRYRMHDETANLSFDYSRRQANYRSIDLDVADYRARRMLVQYLDGSGWFNADMLKIINEQHLLIPDLAEIRREVQRLRRGPGPESTASDQGRAR